VPRMPCEKPRRPDVTSDGPLRIDAAGCFILTRDMALVMMSPAPTGLRGPLDAGNQGRDMVDRIHRFARPGTSYLRYPSFLAAVLLMGVGAGTVIAAETETRRFAIEIDGKPAGTYQMMIRQEADGASVLTCQAHAKVKFGFVTMYRYSYLGTETWKDGRLVRLDSTTNDNGEQYAIVAEAQADGMRLKVNGKERTVAGNVWTTTYWRLPDPVRANVRLALLDPDSGKVSAGQLELIDEGQMEVGGNRIPCKHYRVSGDVKVELWFDAGQRLLRQDSVEDGHRTVLRLEELSR
jgi:Family of unknown function (DUF6134)